MAGERRGALGAGRRRHQVLVARQAGRAHATRANPAARALPRHQVGQLAERAAALSAPARQQHGHVLLPGAQRVPEHQDERLAHLKSQIESRVLLFILLLYLFVYYLSVSN